MPCGHQPGREATEEAQSALMGFGEGLVNAVLCQSPWDKGLWPRSSPAAYTAQLPECKSPTGWPLPSLLYLPLGHGFPCSLPPAPATLNSTSDFGGCSHFETLKWREQIVLVSGSLAPSKPDQQCSRK